MPSSKQDENRLEADDLPVEAEFVVEPEDEEEISVDEVKSGDTAQEETTALVPTTALGRYLV
ncbi:MAG: hypothetical protein OXL95_10970, partial [Nitrospira sp.]|nr:hypothetical protein [Nitrospira sp.]